MSGLVLLVLLGCVCTSVGQAELNKLGEGYRAGTELAVKQINVHPGLQNHFMFFKSLKHSELDAGFGGKFLYHHFLLKPTYCRKGTKDSAQSKCSFRNDKPMIDCVTCYKTFNDAVEENPKPYIHCVHRPTLTKGMVSTRQDHCDKMSYSSGSASVLLVKSPK